MNKTVAIVDYGLGNLFSIQQACKQVGMETVITSNREIIDQAAAIILPGVGAFGEAMASLKELGLERPLRNAASDGKPFLGICLGMQLLMKESFEFGRHEGLGILDGSVMYLKEEGFLQTSLKIPHIGWSAISMCKSWQYSLLDGLETGVAMYFVHSFYCKLADTSLVLSWTEFGSSVFCSSLRKDNVEAVQYHPERSGRQGLRIYENFARRIKIRS